MLSILKFIDGPKTPKTYYVKKWKPHKSYKHYKYVYKIKLIYSATIIQSICRGYLLRKMIRNICKIQSQFRGYQMRKIYPILHALNCNFNYKTNKKLNIKIDKDFVIDNGRLIICNSSEYYWYMEYKKLKDAL